MINMLPPNLLPFLALLLALGLCYMYASKSSSSTSSSSSLPFEEGFQQSHPFLFKRDNDIYDSFYAEIYDTLHAPTTTVLDLVLDSSGLGAGTGAGAGTDREYVTFLEIGSGTGFHMNALFQKGFSVFGVDISKPMNDYSSQKYPHLRPFIQTANAVVPMTYDSNTFSHILCINRTIYHFQNKRDLFNNCFHWLQSNGLFALQLADPVHFDPIVPFAKHKCLGACKDPTNVDVMETILREDRVRESEIRFGKMHYRGSWTDHNHQHQQQTSTTDDADAHDKTAYPEIFTEHFVDDVSGHARQHELTMHFDSLDAILLLAKNCGFIVHSQTAVPGSSSSDTLLILEKPHASM